MDRIGISFRGILADHYFYKDLVGVSARNNVLVLCITELSSIQEKRLKVILQILKCPIPDIFFAGSVEAKLKAIRDNTLMAFYDSDLNFVNLAKDNGINAVYLPERSEFWNYFEGDIYRLRNKSDETIPVVIS